MRLIALLVVLALIGAACSGAESSPADPGDGTVAGMLVASDVERGDPQAPESDVDRVAMSQREFAADLYGRLSPTGNLVFSPVSVYTALAMAYTGAASTTAAEMASMLGANLGSADFHAAMNVLDQALAARNREATEFEGAIELSIANSLWGQEGMEFEPEFLDLLARDYGSGMRVVDFIEAAAREEARQAINAWVAGETNDRIDELLQDGVLDSMVRLVLVNAVYLNAAWQTPFDEAATSDQSFTLLDGSERSVPTMSQELTLPYATDSGWQAIRLPYAGNELGMLIVVPEAGEFEEVANRLADGLLDEVSESVSASAVRLDLPKFEIRSQIGLIPALQSMGLDEATSERADFSGMTGAKDLFISDVIHEAWISADEAGTEAAAATAVMMSLTAAPLEPIVLSIDRPFLFALEDIETGSVLFMGRVVDPGA